MKLPNLFYSIRQTRTLLGGISHSTAYRLISAGKLDARKILGKTVVSAESIERLVSELPLITKRPTCGKVGP